MSATIVHLLIQIVAGIVGGNAIGSGLPDTDLGRTGNTIAGALGGVGLTQLLAAFVPLFSGSAGGVDLTAVIGQAVAGGAVLTTIVGLVRKAMEARQ